MKNSFAFHFVAKLPLLVVFAFFLNSPVLADMDNYCASPAFLGQKIAPNVMVVLDNSGSMCSAAYANPYNPGQFASGVYYGYYDGNTNYRYDGAKWEPTTDLMSTATLDHPIATGSLLNWATMRRVDVSKKVLIGGKANPRTYTPGNPVTLYPGSGCTGARTHYSSISATDIQPSDFNGGCQFKLYGHSTDPWLRIQCGSTVRSYYLPVDQGTTNARGVLDELNSQVRFGLTYFDRYSNGGEVNEYIAFDAANQVAASANNMAPNTSTPAGETMYEVLRYFRQDSPHYSASPPHYTVGSGNFTGTAIYRDPYAYNFSATGSTLSDQYVRCAKSFVLFLTDGQPWSDCDASLPSFLNNLSQEAGGANANRRYAGTPYSSNRDCLIDAAYWGRTRDMRPGTETDVPTTWRKSLPGMQNVVLYPVFLFGGGGALLKDAAIYGGFKDIKDASGNYNNRPDCLIRPAECYRDSNNNGVIESDGSDDPLTYYECKDGYALERDLKKVIMDMLERATSGTAATVLGSSEGAGVVAMQSIFYPQRTFNSLQDLSWIGDTMNYWYYLDPYLEYTQIREDTVREDSNYTLLDLKNDYIADFRFDPSPNQQKTFVDRCRDDDGNGSCDTPAGSVNIEESRPVWSAGMSLWWTDPGNRTIWTSVDGSNLSSFEITGLTTDIENYMGQTGTTAEETIRYVRGIDGRKLCSVSRTSCVNDSDCPITEVCAPTRSRTASIKVCSTSKVPCNIHSDCVNFGGGTCGEETHVWKLGDIISSTPRVLGPAPLNNYDQVIPRGYSDASYGEFIETMQYEDRGTVFSGSNDGLFHAFNMGKLSHQWAGKEWWQIGRIDGTVGASGSIGTEKWAFIPRNVLPYLQYLSREDYDHIYMADGPIVMADVSIHVADPLFASDYWEFPKTKDSWKTVVISSMGIGGATCHFAGGASSGPGATCIEAPHKVGDTSAGMSSYFALDVTDQSTPEILWEFPGVVEDALAPKLGATNVGAAIVKVGGKEKRCSLAATVDCSLTPCASGQGVCTETNGRWFAILASGPTGPINNKSYLGTSDQNLFIFVVDLKTGDLVHTIDTGITQAFAGSLTSSSIDLERHLVSEDGHYQDDAVYIGYVQNETKGGVLRLVTGDDPDPTNWAVSPVIENTGPITSSVVNLLDTGNDELWLYFGEGRYYHKLDDLANQRRIYGMRETCFRTDPANPTAPADLKTNCTDTIDADAPNFNTYMKDQTSTIAPLGASQVGWYVNLDTQAGDDGAERVISNPTVSPMGAVYFVSFKPNTDICGLGGTSYTWAFDYSSGGAVGYVQEGKALVQTSTGAVDEVDLETAFSTRNNRRSVGTPGVPPAGSGPVTIVNPLPVKKFMHVQEE